MLLESLSWLRLGAVWSEEVRRDRVHGDGVFRPDARTHREIGQAGSMRRW